MNNLKNKTEQLEIKAKLMQEEEDISDPRKFEIRNIRSVLIGTLDFLKEHPENGYLVSEQIKLDIDRMRIRLEYMEENPLFAGNHQNLLDEDEALNRR